MSVTATFLATVTKVPIALRLELVSIHIIFTIIHTMAIFLDAEILIIYSQAIARLACSSLVGYATIPGFNLAFNSVIASSARVVILYANSLRKALPF